LSQYHRMMGEAITAHDGTLEHFAGDGVMVFFNDPIPQEDHVERAVRMAVAMRDRFAELAAIWRERGYELGFGVGIAVGSATLGRIGFEGRHDYGAIGNVTILASRLSSQAQAGQILLSPRAQTLLGELIESESVGELTLKGLARPVLASNVVAMR
jgi:adenylate cyclase